jgi:hypothetical protein
LNTLTKNYNKLLLKNYVKPIKNNIKNIIFFTII